MVEGASTGEFGGGRKPKMGRWFEGLLVSCSLFLSFFI